MTDAERPPALLLLRLTQTAPALRGDGPGSGSARAAFAAADAELARLLGCFDAAGLLADAAVAVVGDRVFEPVHSAVLPNAALAEARLVDLEPTGGVRELARARPLERRLRVRLRARRGPRRRGARACSRGSRAGAEPFASSPPPRCRRAAPIPTRGSASTRPPGFSFGDEARGAARRARRGARRLGPAQAGRGRDARLRRVRARLPARRARAGDVAARRGADPGRRARPRPAGRRGPRARRPPRRSRARPRVASFSASAASGDRHVERSVRRSRSSSIPPSGGSTTACARASSRGARPARSGLTDLVLLSPTSSCSSRACCATRASRSATRRWRWRHRLRALADRPDAGFLFGPLGALDDLLVVAAARLARREPRAPRRRASHWPGQGDVLDAIHRVDWSEQVGSARVRTCGSAGLGKRPARATDGASSRRAPSSTWRSAEPACASSSRALRAGCGAGVPRSTARARVAPVTRASSRRRSRRPCAATRRAPTRARSTISSSSSKRAGTQVVDLDARRCEVEALGDVLAVRAVVLVEPDGCARARGSARSSSGGRCPSRRSRRTGRGARSRETRARRGGGPRCACAAAAAR